ncbi:MAG: DNA repair protein RecO [candidate division Zixibacteria bacterium]|nr:DNA repair protein RecO [candidate division Zixibacteria bacterium]
MSVCATDAIVLNRTLMGDSSLLVTLYTRDFGKIKTVARGARKANSKSGPALQPFMIVSATFRRKEHQELQTLNQADVLTVFRRLSEDLTRMAYASAVTELVNRLVIGEEPSHDLFELIRHTLHALNTQPPEAGEAIFWRFQLRFAASFGYAIQFVRCTGCARELEETNPHFSPALGGVLCERCVTQDAGAFLVTPGAVKLLNGVAAMPVDLLSRLKPSRTARQEIVRVIRSFFLYHLEDARELKALKFLQYMEEDQTAVPPTAPS